MKARILHILWEGIGGSERIVLELTRHLDPQKYEITLIILGQGGCVTGLIDRKKVRVLEFGCRSGVDILTMRAVYSFLFSNKFDIIHNHERSLLLNFALITIKPRPALIYHEHGGALLSGSFRTRLFYAVFARFYNAFIAIHKDMVCYKVQAARVCAEKTTIIENPVDVDYFKPINETKKQSEVSKNQGVIGTVARLVPQKDFGLFLETASHIIRRRPDIKFVIYGNGPLMQSLKDASKGPELKGRVAVLGSTSEVPKVLSSFDLFLFTSRFESFGMTLIEALACGVPVLATLPEAGGARALLEELPGVCLVRERDPDAMARAALDLYTNPISMRKMGQAGREFIVANYSSTEYARNMDALYDRLLKRK